MVYGSQGVSQTSKGMEVIGNGCASFSKGRKLVMDLHKPSLRLSGEYEFNGGPEVSRSGALDHMCNQFFRK